MKRETLWLLLIVLGVAALATGAAVIAYTGSRGLRNNNPGNIRKDGTQWQGMAPTQTDPAFVQFIAPEWGIRAMTKILANYFGRGLNTVQEIINTWAPPTENDTASYVAHVAGLIGVSADAVLPGTAVPALVAAIIQHENGQQPYPAELIAQGVTMGASGTTAWA